MTEHEPGLEGAALIRTDQDMEQRIVERQGTGTDWLAAYALSMAFSGQSDEFCVDQLLDAADSDLDMLEAARGRVLGVSVGDEATRRHASQLLDQAAARLRRI